MAELLGYGFVQTALAASAIVAVVSGALGYFLVLRGQSFAGHALAHVGFAGATGALLLGAPPLAGLIVTGVAAGAGMGLVDERLASRDVAIGMILALSLGVGLLFLSLFTTGASAATSLLFGNVFGVGPATLRALAAMGAISLAGLAAIARPLLFASLQPELADARGVPRRLLSMLFLALVGLTTAGCTQIVGVLLVFSLMVAPAAAAHLLTTRVWPGLALSAALALGQAWAGIALAIATDWPASFWITLLGALAFAAAAASGIAGERR